MSKRGIVGYGAYSPVSLHIQQSYNLILTKAHKTDKNYKPLRDSKTRRLTTASEASWLNPPQPSPSAMTSLPYSPDSIRQPPVSPELDDTSTNIISKRHKQRFSELPGSSPPLSSLTPPPPPGCAYRAELPADEEVTVKAPPSLSSQKSPKKDKVRAIHNKTKTNDDVGDEEDQGKRQTLLISPTLPEHDHPLPSPTQAQMQAQARLETPPIITINGMGIDMGTGVSSSSDRN